MVFDGFRRRFDAFEPFWSRSRAQIVLSGGSTMFEKFGDRLLSEVKKLAPKAFWKGFQSVLKSAEDIKIRISAPPERKLSTWIGLRFLMVFDGF